jgi:asparagine synthase (glutamine-hydrolysing)
LCGILSILDIRRDATTLRDRALTLSGRLRHRGPDWSGIWSDDRAILAHERLAIVDPQSGGQPLVHPSGDLILAVNGEIYNHAELRRSVEADYDFQTASDCEVLLPLYEHRGADFLNDLNGIFAFVLYDRRTGGYLIARDPMGVVPLYTGTDEIGQRYVSSELKGLADVCKTLAPFPPGHYLTDADDAPVPYYLPTWRNHVDVTDTPLDLDTLRQSLEAAVKRQLMCDVPFGVLLSGGLDSSIVAAVAQKFASHRVESGDADPAWWPRLHSFSIGLRNAPDLEAARLAAASIGTVHHELIFTLQEGLDALRDVIYHIETYDVTSIRASTPMYLMARQIKAMGIKMVLSGEGADEIFGGYLYFHKAPGAAELHDETVRKLDALHLFDCLRANKSTAAWGVEARVPFLDREFLDVAMAFDPAEKLIGPDRMEKWVLRKAFESYLPPEILWRQKEQFSDGVGYAWIDALRDHAASRVTDAELAEASHRFPVNTPPTKEAYLYREIFESHFPQPHAVATVPGGPSIACSTPTAIAWDETFAANADPSGRAVLSVHQQPK